MTTGRTEDYDDEAAMKLAEDVLNGTYDEVPGAWEIPVEELPEEEKDQTFYNPGNAFEEFLDIVDPLPATTINEYNLRSWLEATDKEVGLT